MSWLLVNVLQTTVSRVICFTGQRLNVFLIGLKKKQNKQLQVNSWELSRVCVCVCVCVFIGVGGEISLGLHCKTIQ